MRTKSVDEYVRRYVVSSVESALNLTKYWKRKGLNDSEAEKRALNQAMGMIVSGYSSNLDKAKDSILELRDWCDRILLKIWSDCERCKFMPCLDLYRQDDVREDAGGEIHILQSMLKNSFGRAVYHNTGGMLGSMEDVIIGIMEILPKNLILTHMFFWHVLRDLRASAFLAFCGRYKQASSVLRSALELIFVGIYFQSLEDRGLKEEYEKVWREWWGGRNLFGNGLKAAMGHGWLDIKMKESSGRLWGDLSGSVHRMEKDEYDMVVEKDLERARPASSFYNTKFLEGWFESLYQIIIIMEHMLEILPFKHNNRSRGGLDLLRNMISALKTDKKDPLPFVECPILSSY